MRSSTRSTSEISLDNLINILEFNFCTIYFCFETGSRAQGACDPVCMGGRGLHFTQTGYCPPPPTALPASVHRHGHCPDNACPCPRTPARAEMSSSW